MRHFVRLLIIIILFVLGLGACATVDKQDAEATGPLTSPVIDFDGDGIPDNIDDDDDNDGYTDKTEKEAGTDPYNTFDHPAGADQG